MAFYTGLAGQGDMANSIKALANAGCNIIVDDVYWCSAPFFIDGIIAQAVDSVVNNMGVTYFAGANNLAR